MVAVGIIVAVSIFLLKPALDSADHAVDRGSEASERISNNVFRQTQQQTREINRAVEEANRTVQRQVHRSYHVAKVQGGPKAPDKLINCVQRASGDVKRMQRCAHRYGATAQTGP